MVYWLTPFLLKNINLKNITLYEYIATNVPSDAHFTINKFDNYRMARSPKELEYQLKNFVKKFGENGLNALAEIHPDKNLLEVNCASCKSSSSFSGNDQELTSPQSRFVNANGSDVLVDDKLRKSQITLSQALIFSGMALIGVAIIMRR